MICGEEVFRPSNGVGGLPKYAPVMAPCGRPAVVLARGVVERPDGSVYLQPWRPQCKAHHDPSWEAWVRSYVPKVGNRPLVRPIQAPDSPLHTR